MDKEAHIVMLKRFLPKQENFFKLFEDAADKLPLAATEFSNLLKNLNNYQHYVNLIAQYEQEGDQIAHTIFALMHKSFITPFDRYDIHALTSALDDVIDLINRIAQRFPFYQLNTIPIEMVQLSEISVATTEHLRSAVYMLHSLKNSELIFEHCDAIDRLEGEGHQIVLAGEKKLFLEEDDFKHFFKLKEIYSHSKLVINRCQDISNIIKGIILEYS